jgi:hypothetical protein
MWMMRWILLISIMLPERPGTTLTPWQWGEIQQSTKKATIKTAMATEMGTVTDSNDNNVNANANDSASTTVTRTTCPGCASWW